MDKNRIIGAAEAAAHVKPEIINAAKGAVKLAIGQATGDAKLQSDGNADKIEGKTRNAIGGLSDTPRDALK